jgi:hypothetical protein
MDFPDNLVIELRKDPSVEFVATAVHVTNVPVQLHSDPPVVVQTFAKGDTPLTALANLLDQVNRGGGVA